MMRLRKLLKYYGISIKDLHRYRLLQKDQEYYLISVDDFTILETALAKLAGNKVRYLGIKVFDKDVLSPEASTILGRYTKDNYIVIDYRRFKKYLDAGIDYIYFEDVNEDKGSGTIKILFLSIVDDIKYPVGLVRKHRQRYKVILR